MTDYIQGKDGKFAGSIGTGKSSVPAAAPLVPGAFPEAVAAAEADEAFYSEYYERFQESTVSVLPNGLVLNDEKRAEVVGILNEIGRIAEENVKSLDGALEQLERIKKEGDEALALINLRYAHLPIEEAMRAEESRGTKFAVLHQSYYEKYPEPQSVEDLEKQLADVRVQQEAAGVLERDVLLDELKAAAAKNEGK